MKTEHIEEFFETGLLVLGSYGKYKKREDIRKDEREGFCNFHLENEGFAYSGVQSVGAASFMLCGSVNESDDLMSRFGVDNYLVVTDVLGFADAVSRAIPGFLEGKLGACSYRSGRQISKKVAKSLEIDSTELLNAKKYEDITKAFYGNQKAMADRINYELIDESFFVKDVAYEKEAEFRMVWRASRKVGDGAKIDCRDAIKFCAPGRPLSRNVSKIELDADQNISLITGFTHSTQS
ncbi:hypothetical protein [Diaphorobacter sp.]|uniref:hypothetical protein n=1 Tax=Diaphorobacter sp. TaxID=1934310 RepID=UPI003D0B8922